jgi:hypothetical protein
MHAICCTAVSLVVSVKPGSRDAFTVTFVLIQGMYGGESLSTVAALYLLPTIGVHPFMTTQIRELCVRLETDFTLKWLHGAVHVLMLF